MRKKLVSILGARQIWDFYSVTEEKLVMKDVSNIPFLQYPDRTPCIEANLYMLSIVNGRSLKFGGGYFKAICL